MSGSTTTLRLHHRLDGPADGPLLVLGPSLGTDLTMWDPLLGALIRRHRVLRFDNPGHGSSPAGWSPAGPSPATARRFGVADLADAVVTLVDELGGDRFAFCGLSLGGAVGQRIALDRPGRLTALVLCCTAAKFGDSRAWRDRAARVRAEGTEWLVETSRARWFAGHEPADAGRLLDVLRATDPNGYAGCADALADFDVRDLLPAVDVPTLVVAGADDPATPVAEAERLASGIPRAELVVLPGAAHLAPVQCPAEVSRAILDHLERAGP